MIRASFKCESCEFTEVLKFKDKIPPVVGVECPTCHKPLKRLFKNIEFEKEAENVSAAIQTMLYAHNPSGKEKTII